MNPNALHVEGVAFYGRTLEEYRAIFDFDPAQWTRKRVLDCPAGPSSFVAEAREAGVLATGCDPVFAGVPKAIMARCRADIERVIAGTRGVQHLFKWDFYVSPDDLKAHRLNALEGFARDYPADHYVAAALPRLPFANDSFDLVLSGHFLLLYGDRFEYAFQLASLRELARVAAEVRVYPLQGLDARPYPHLAELKADLERHGLAAEEVPVAFEFQRGSDRLLRVQRK